MKTQKILTALLMIAAFSVVSCSKKKDTQGTAPVVDGTGTGDAGKDTAGTTGGDTGGNTDGDGQSGGTYIEIGGASSPHSEIFKLMQDNPGAANLDMVAKILPVIDPEFKEFDAKEFVVVVANVDGEGATKLGTYSGFDTRHVNLSNKAGKASVIKLEGKNPESLQIGEVKIEMVVNADGVMLPKEPNDLEYNAQMPVVYSVSETAVAKANLPIAKVSDPANVIELKVEGGNEDLGIEATDAVEGQKDVCSLTQLSKDAEGKVSGILINNIVDIANASLTLSKLTPDDLAKLPQDTDIKLDIVCFALVKNKTPTILITTSPIVVKVTKAAEEKVEGKAEAETTGDDAGKTTGDDAGAGTSGPEEITPNGGAAVVDPAKAKADADAAAKAKADADAAKAKADADAAAKAQADAAAAKAKADADAAAAALKAKPVAKTPAAPAKTTGAPAKTPGAQPVKATPAPVKATPAPATPAAQPTGTTTPPAKSKGLAPKGTATGGSGPAKKTKAVTAPTITAE